MTKRRIFVKRGRSFNCAEPSTSFSENFLKNINRCTLENYYFLGNRIAKCLRSTSSKEYINFLQVTISETIVYGSLTEMSALQQKR